MEEDAVKQSHRHTWENLAVTRPPVKPPPCSQLKAGDNHLAPSTARQGHCPCRWTQDNGAKGAVDNVHVAAAGRQVG